MVVYYSLSNQHSAISGCKPHIHSGGELVKPRAGPHPLFGVEEFRTDEDLDAFLFTENAMSNLRLQALIVTERVLGSLNKETIFR